MTDYTPRPWKVRVRRPTSLVDIIAPDTASVDGGRICTVASYDNSNSDKANAELIASAPRLKEERDELLLAGQRALHAIDEAIGTGNASFLADSAYVFEARELIAKVEK